MTPDGLVALIVVNDNVSLASGSGLAEVDGVGAKVGVCEQGLAVPGGGVLYADETSDDVDAKETNVPHPRSGTGPE